MYEDLNLPSRANRKCGREQLRDLCGLGDVCLYDRRLTSSGLDLGRYFLGLLPATLRGVVDDYVGASLPQLDGDGGADSPNGSQSDWNSTQGQGAYRYYLEAPVTMAVLPLRSRPEKLGILYEEFAKISDE